MQLHSGRRTRMVLCGMLAAFLLILCSGNGGHFGDKIYWADWIKWDLAHGLRNAYGSGTNYPPLYHYALWLFGKVMRTHEAVDKYIGWLRVFALAAEFWGLWIVYRWVDRSTDYLLIVLVSLLNIGYSYNTLIWNQADSIAAAFSFAALYALYRGRRVLSGIALVLAVNMKLQSLVFVPLWALLFIENASRMKNWRALPATVLCMAMVQTIIVAPFAFGGGGLHAVWEGAVGFVDAQHFVSENAHNWWYWTTPSNAVWKPLLIDDRLPFFAGLSYRAAGLILFFAASACCFFPLLRHTGRQVFRSKGNTAYPPPSREVIWLTAALSIVLFFFLNTEMHERYPHSAAIFLAAYAFYTRRWGLYVLFSIAYALNLESIMRWAALPNYETFVFDPRINAALYAVLILGMLYSLYRLPQPTRNSRLSVSASTQ